MAFSINDMRGSLVHGGWRPSHFQVIITNPFDTTSDLKTPMMVRAAQLPAYNVGQIPVYYFGRAIFQPGDRTVEPWTTTIINDEDFVVKNALEVWHGQINAMQRNVSSTNLVNELKSTGLVTAYGKDGRVLRQYQLNALWPMSISSIETDWTSTDNIGEFQVTWSFDDVEVIGGVTGSGGAL
jgi:hypothetical protein